MLTFRRLLVVLLMLAPARPAQALFHVMQIEQLIGGLNGDATSQAIQLRMRSASQNITSSASLWAADANGANRVLLLNIGANVANSAAGDRVLITSNAFKQYLNTHGFPTFTPDFTLASLIPTSYFNAGRLTFEQDGGTVATPGIIYWSLSWGGAGYTGPTTGNTQNDADGNFGPSFGSSLTAAGRSSIRFNGTASAPSTTNLANYSLASDPLSVVKNNRTSFQIPVPEPTTLALTTLGLATLLVGWRARR